MATHIVKEDFNAQTVLAATADDTPLPLTVAASTFLGRKSTGDVAAMNKTQALAELNVTDGADVTGDNAPQAHTVASHSDTTATGAELEELTDGSTTSLHSHSGGGLSGLFQNAIINPSGQIGQRGTSFDSSTTPANNDDTYLLDRWNLLSDGNDTFDVSYDSTEDAIKLDVETAKRGGICQILENKNAKRFDGKSVSLSFSVKSANIAALRAVVLSWDSTADTVTSDVVNSWAATPTWATNWTAENTPGDLTVTGSYTTVTIENISVDTASMANLAVFIWTPNEESIGDIVYIREIQLNEGTTALAFSPRQYTEEITLCYRYYFKKDVYQEGCTAGGYQSTTIYRGLMHYLTEMRIAPTLAISGHDALDVYAENSSEVSTTIATGPVSVRSAELAVWTAAVSAAGLGAYCRVRSGEWLSWDAEL